MTSTSASDGGTDTQWFDRTGHCGRCGQPGQYCLCRASSPCGCRHLHEMGSGLQADPVDVFADSTIDQEGLF